jgi:hypothetical protein
MLDHTDILRYHDEAYTASQNVRERAADDLVFARVTQWDDAYLGTQLEYRGQFDMIRKARRKNLSEMRANPVQVSYLPGLEGVAETAEVLEKLYRHDMTTPGAKQATVIAQQDQLDCGLGAWRLVTDYDNSILNEQFIKREPIHEANNRVFRDPNCMMPDSSDATYQFVIWTITKEGWAAFAESIGADPDNFPSNWMPPEDSNVFPWTYENQFYNIGEFYHRERVKRTGFVLEHPQTGDSRIIDEDDAEDVIDQALQEGYEFVEEREYETYEVTKYWCSGGGFLVEPEVIVGTEIPIVTLFGEVSKVENQWHWEGIVRLAKDPQRLRNFMMSYLADIAAKGSRQRPYFGMSQIEGLEWQFEEGGPDQNAAYRVLNDYDDDGNPLPAGPVSYEQTPEVPAALAGLLEATAVAIDDVTNPGVPQDIASTNLSGKAVTALQNQVDMQTYIYIDNFAMALQREAEIYAAMVPDVYDTTRELGLVSEEGEESMQIVNNMVIDWESGKVIKAVDLTRGQYKVRTKVSPAFQSRRAQERGEKIELFAASAGNPEAQNVLLLEIMTLADSDVGVSNTYARRQLLQMGLLEAESDDDEEYMQTLQEEEGNQPPDPMMIAAQAEMEKAKADNAKTQVDQFNAETNKFKAETERYKAMVEAKRAGASVQLDGITAQGKTLDNMGKMQDMQTREITLDLSTGSISQGA